MLPRGAGICTRRPIVISLKHGPTLERDQAQFSHKPDVFTDFELVKREIDEETARSLGPGKQVSGDPIMMTVSGPKLPTLTLVDMPGLTKVATDNQDPSTVASLRQMTLAYVRKPSVIILAVTPATVDIATSDAFQLAREVDPQGLRTIGCLTKIDLMDKGTDAVEVLEGRAVRLKLGWFGVINRSQADINERKLLSDGREKEREFFSSHDKYRHMVVGTPALTAKLTTTLEEAVRTQLPRLQQLVGAEKAALEQELHALGGDVMLDDRGALVHTILSACTAFENAFAELLDGGKGGGRLREVFERSLRASVDNLPYQDIFNIANVERVIVSSEGYAPHLVAPEQGVRNLIKLGIAQLHGPAKDVVDSVHATLIDLLEETARAATEAERTATASGAGAVGGGSGAALEAAAVLTNSAGGAASLRRFKQLLLQLKGAARATLDKSHVEARRFAETLVTMEEGYISARTFRRFCRDTAAAAIKKEAPPETQMPTPTPTPTNEASSSARSVKAGDLHNVAEGVSGYVHDVAARLLELLPKACVTIQVAAAKKSLLAAVVAKVGNLTEEQLRQLVAEDPAEVERRLDCGRRLELLRTAAHELSREWSR